MKTRAQRHQHALDDIDCQILKILQTEPSISNVKIAEMVNLSPPPVLRRKERLEDFGYIKGSISLINEDKFGRFLKFIIECTTLDPSKEKELLDFSSENINIREHFLLNPFDRHILHTIFEDYDQFLIFKEKLSPLCVDFKFYSIMAVRTKPPLPDSFIKVTRANTEGTS